MIIIHWRYAFLAIWYCVTSCMPLTPLLQPKGTAGSAMFQSYTFDPGTTHRLYVHIWCGYLRCGPVAEAVPYAGQMGAVPGTASTRGAVVPGTAMRTGTASADSTAVSLTATVGPSIPPPHYSCLLRSLCSPTYFDCSHQMNNDRDDRVYIALIPDVI
jgi:hypothetical protein